jgi:hypothetical protein
MLREGIPNQFKPHSTRAASSSCAFRKGMILTDIINMQDGVMHQYFAKFYNKPLINREANTFQNNVLESYCAD